MKVGGPGKIQSPSVKKSKGASKSSGSDFASQVSTSGKATPSGGIASSGPLTSVDALLGLQEMPDATAGRSKGLQFGRDLLDQLENIRRGLLLGTIPVHQLQKLAESLSKRKDQFQDPDLKGVLDEIELRARVELAKLEVGL